MVYGIIGAMESEVSLLTSHMQGVETTSAAGLTFYNGTLCGACVVVVRCGVGKVNAAACAQMLIDRFAVDALINVGVAGGLDARLNVCDIVVATGLVQHDFDLRLFGHAKGYLGEAYGGDHSKPTVFETDEALSARIVAAATALFDGEHACLRGVVASGDEFVASAARRESIITEFDAMATEMEGAAIAQVASQNGVPFAVLRTISDLADGSAPISFEKVVTFAADTAAKIIMQMLENA